MQQAPQRAELSEPYGPGRSRGRKCGAPARSCGQAAPPPNEGPARPETAAGQRGWETFVSFLRRCVTNRFEVWRWEEPIVSIPLLIFILLVLLAFWISVPLLIIGLIMGCRYRFAGPDLDGNEVSQAVNHAADTVSDAVGRAKAQAEQAARGKQSKE